MSIGRRDCLLSLILVLFTGTVGAAETAAPLTFEERVEAQRAIESVFHRHRIWPDVNPGPKPPLAAILSDTVLRARVADYLRKSDALDKLWNAAPSASDLQAELDRMARDTRDAAVLSELFAALGRDPRLIAETLARRTVVDRRLRSLYAREEKLPGGAYLAPDVPKPGFDDWWAKSAREYSEFHLEPPASYVLPEIDAGTTDVEGPVYTGSTVPDGRTAHTAVWAGRDMIVWGGLDGSSNRLDSGGLYNPAVDAWLPTSTTGVPDARDSHTAIWTGVEMIVWGGVGATLGTTNTGGLYVPATDSWTATSTGANVPTARSGHTAVWTGTVMIVWGSANHENTGGRYDPTTDTWTATSTGAGVPAGRELHTAAWTGTEMIVWGGESFNVVAILENTGGRYDPGSDTWTATSTAGAVPSARRLHTAVWSGAEMIVWGGEDNGGEFDTGGRYDPSTDMWTATTTTGAPTARSLHAAVWSGSEMIVYGGNPAGPDGGRYSPGTDSWTQINDAEAGNRTSHSVIWTGLEMVVWGGGSSLDTGWRWSPLHGWEPTATFGGFIRFPPQPQTTILGGTARFTVVVSGDSPITHQWLRGGMPIGPQTVGSSSVLTLTDVTTADAGTYDVRITDALGFQQVLQTTLTVTTPQGGDVDFSFDPGSSINDEVSALAIQPNGKVVIGGSFGSVSGVARGGIARLNADGTTDHTFGNGQTGANSYILSIATQADGRVLIGGSFSTVNGVSRNNIARLNADGTLDSTFLNGLAGANFIVYSIAVQPDGRVLIAGDFTTVNGTSRNRIARLNADGSLDATFLNGLTGADHIVQSIVLQPDGRVLIGGWFTTVNGVSRNRVARLNADGTLDTTFLNGLTGANNIVRSLAVQSDGRVLIGGDFTTVDGTSRNRIARLNADGSLDTTFLNGLTGAGRVPRSRAP